jgi:hypothetical protein
VSGVKSWTPVPFAFFLSRTGQDAGGTALAAEVLQPGHDLVLGVIVRSNQGDFRNLLRSGAPGRPAARRLRPVRSHAWRDKIARVE